MRQGRDIPEAMTHALEAAGRGHAAYACLNSADKTGAVVLLGAPRAGRANAAGRVRMATGLSEETAKREEQRAQSQARLYRTSGLLGGILLAVLFL